MSDTYTLVPWSNFARSGKHYAQRIKSGERFAVALHGTNVIALVKPYETGDAITVVVDPERLNRQGEREQ